VNFDIKIDSPLGKKEVGYMRALNYNCQKFLLFVLLASCSASGYRPAYIITDQPLIEVEQAAEELEAEPVTII